MAGVGIPGPQRGPEPGNAAKWLWPLAIAGLVYAGAAARSQKGFAPLAFGGIAAYGVKKAMDNQKDYISLRLFGRPDVFPF
jgi:uncharacterized membrane protein YccC